MYRNATFVAIALYFVLFVPLGYGENPTRLEEIVAANDGLYSHLKSFVCSERIERFASRKRGDPWRHLDTLTAQVSFENGQEHYSEVKRAGQHVTSLSSVPGTWSEGEFGTLLRQTQNLLRTAPVRFDADEEIFGTAVSRVHFDVGERNSQWDLEVAGHHYRVPFRTELWIGKTSSEILRIIRRSTGEIGDTRIATLEWSMTLAPVALNGRTWLLPREGAYLVEYAGSGRREWNELLFSNYHRYGSEVALRFDGPE